MTIQTFLVTAALAVLPISELRGALPYALVKGVPLPLAYLYTVGLNALVAPVGYLFLSTLHGWFIRFRWYERLFTKLIGRARERVGEKVEKYGYLGLALFVAIPLPITGAYTGTLGAWVLGMKPRKAIPIVMAGVAVAGVIVSLVMALGIEALSFFVKQPEL